MSVVLIQDLLFLKKGSLDRTQRMEIESGALTLTEINYSTRSGLEQPPHKREASPIPLCYSTSLQFICLSLSDPSIKSGTVNIATRCPPPHNLMTLFLVIMFGRHAMPLVPRLEDTKDLTSTQQFSP